MIKNSRVHILSAKGSIKALPNTNTLTPSSGSLAATPAQTSLTDIRTNPSQAIGWTGIKFPFQFAPNGRVAISTTNLNDVSHIKESVEQIILTGLRERFFNALFGCELRSLVFEPLTEVSSRFESVIIDALRRWEPRIAINSIIVTPYPNDYMVYIRLNYRVISLQPSTSINHELALDLAA